MGVIPTPWQERFWRYLTPAEPDACWEWRGAKNALGYGRLNSGGRNGATIKAHRASYEIHFGIAPGVLDVCHRCDNPPCCNPAHLFLGDARANARDMASKGRAAAQNGQSLLIERITAGEVVALRERAASGESYESLGAAFGIGSRYAGMLANGTYRKDAGGPVSRRRGHLKYTDAEVIEMRERAAAGEGVQALADAYGTHRTYMSGVLRGRLRPEVGGPIRS